MKTVSLKEIREKAKYLQGVDGFYNNVPLSEIIADLKQAYKEDGYKITK